MQLSLLDFFRRVSQSSQGNMERSFSMRMDLYSMSQERYWMYQRFYKLNNCKLKNRLSQMKPHQ